MVVLAGALASTSARADDAARAAEGETSARAGDYTRAIEAFKAADREHHRVRYTCMIGLAYLRRELWPQAELFLDTCRAQATADDPLPGWFADAVAQLEVKLAAVSVAPVTIVVEPADVHATITISSFAPDETVGPRTIHLAPGTHAIEVRAPGYEPRSQSIAVTGGVAQKVVVRLSRALTPPSRVPLYVIGGGIALGIAGGIYHAAALWKLRDELATTHDPATYDADLATFRTRRAVSISLYAGAALTVAVGVVLKYTAFRRTPVDIGAEVHDGGAVVTLGWNR